MKKNSWQKNEKIIDRSLKVVLKRLHRLGCSQITMNGIFEGGFFLCFGFFFTLP